MEKTKEYRVRIGYAIHTPLNIFHEGAIIKLTDDEAVNKYSHQVEPVEPEIKVVDEIANKAINNKDIKKKGRPSKHN